VQSAMPGERKPQNNINKYRGQRHNLYNNACSYPLYRRFGYNDVWP